MGLLHNFFSPASKIRSVCQSGFSVLGRVVVSEPTTMVGSTSFSSGARISVILSFAVQSIAAPCIGCQKDSVWNGRHRGDFTHHGQDHSFDVARGIPTGYSSTVRGSTVQWPLFTSHNFGALVLTIPVFSLEPACRYCARAYYSQQLVPVQIFLTSSGSFLSRMVLSTVLCHFRFPCYWWFVLNATTTSSTV